VDTSEHLDIIKIHKEKARDEREEWDRYQSWYLSEYNAPAVDSPSGSGGDAESDGDLSLETNYPYAYIDTMVANVCPTNPQVTVNARRKALQPMAIFREALANTTLKDQKAHKAIWRMATQASITGRGLQKAVWNFKRSRPEFVSIDPRRGWFDMTADRWENIRYFIHVTTMTKSEFKQRVKTPGRYKKGKGKGVYDKATSDKVQATGYPEWLRDQVREDHFSGKPAKDAFKWVIVYEFHDYTVDKVFHYADEVPDALMSDDLPYRLLKRNFHLMTFNDAIQDIGGVSDVKLIAPVQERLNEIDSLELWFVHTTIPVLLVNAGLCDNVEQAMAALRNAVSPGMMVQLNGRHNVPLQDIIGQTPTPQLSPSFDKMRARCIEIIEFVLGIPAYTRGAVGTTDVATEVALADTATRTRNGRRMKEVYDTVGWMSHAAVSLYEEFMADDAELAIRLTDSREVVNVTRKDMGAIGAKELRDFRGEGVFDYDYDVVPYSPTENNRLVQLNNMQNFMEMLVNSPIVDKIKLYQKMLQALQMTDIMVDDQKLQMVKQMLEQMEMQQMQPPAPEGPPAAGGPVGALPNMAGGDLPPGVEPPALPTGGPGPAQGSPLPADIEAGFQGSPTGSPL